MSEWRDSNLMLRALALARRGKGHVEPNPMVGCVIAHGDEVVGEGWHQRFGGQHAEVEALTAAGDRVRGATLYVTLEPCCHQGKTPPCTQAIIPAGIKRVVAAMRDPFLKVAGSGFEQLTAAGVEVEVGLHEAEARELNAPYLKLLATGRPWVIAKWAMTLDGKIATKSGDSRWISSEVSRQVVHQIRSRVDAIVVGRRTAELDDPLLTARLEQGLPLRVATRIVLDSSATLGSNSQLVQTARTTPTMIVAGPAAPKSEVQRLSAAGCEVLRLTTTNHEQQLCDWLDELGRRRMTNILVEGGGELLGALFDAQQIDEVHVFIAPKLVGGAGAPAPLAGAGLGRITDADAFATVKIEKLAEDVYIHGRLRRP